MLVALRLRCYMTFGIRIAGDGHIISSCVFLLEGGQHLLMLCKYVLQAQTTFCLCSSTLSFMPTPLSWLLIWSTSSASECTAGWCQNLHTSLHSWCVLNFPAVSLQSCHAAICQFMDSLSSCNCDCKKIFHSKQI